MANIDIADPTPTYAIVRELVLDIARTLGKAAHATDAEHHPELDREEIISLFNEIEVSVKKMGSPLVDLSMREIEAGVWKP